jgi:hypothetical protein
MVLAGRDDQEIPGIQFDAGVINKKSAVPFNQVEKLIKGMIVRVRLKVLIGPPLLIDMKMISKTPGVS